MKNKYTRIEKIRFFSDELARHALGEITLTTSRLEYIISALDWLTSEKYIEWEQGMSGKSLVQRAIARKAQ